MSETISPAAKADRLNRRRARMMPVLAMFVLLQQTAFFSTGDRDRTVDLVRNGGWVALTVVIVTLLVGGGFWFRSREVRELLEDDVTRANRGSALTLGFTVAMVGAIAMFALESFSPGFATTREAIHLIVTFGLVAALLRFGLLERRMLG